MKFIKIKDTLLESINEGTVRRIAIINDQDDLSMDEKIEFFNDENVAFGSALIDGINIQKFSKELIEQGIEDILITDFAEDDISDSDRVKTISFSYEQYEEPRSLSRNEDLNTDSLKIYADGGSRGNPGPSASGYVILTENDELIKAAGVYLGITTNNQAEYKSIKFALQDALELGGKYITVFMDSLLVVNQVNGKFKIRNEALYPIYRDIKDLAQQFESITFTHVPRALNKLADAEVNKCLDDALGIK